MPVLEIGAEVMIAHAISLASPGDRAASQVIAADPGERPIGRRRIWMFAVTHPPLLGSGVEGITGALNGVVTRALFLRNHAAIRHFPGRGEILVIDFVFDVTSALDQQRLQAALA